jgi:hypothetical protein
MSLQKSLNIIAKKKITILGEYFGNPQVQVYMKMVQERLLQRPGILNIVMGIFSFEM